MTLAMPTCSPILPYCHSIGAGSIPLVQFPGWGHLGQPSTLHLMLKNGWCSSDTRLTFWVLRSTLRPWQGWSPHFNIMWCITKAELCSLGFSMVMGSEPSTGSPATTIHINILEFITLCINVWFALAFYLHDNPLGTNHHVGNFLANNTSALSWMAHVGRVHTLPTHCLTRFLQILLTFSPLHFQFQSHHISSHSNDTADLLSQPSHAKSWASVINTCPTDLHTCLPYLVSHTLLSVLRDCIVSNETMVLSVAKMIAQSISTPPILLPGWAKWDTMIGLCNWLAWLKPPCSSKVTSMRLPPMQEHVSNPPPTLYKAPPFYYN